MKRVEALNIIYTALVSYVEDCAGRESEEAKTIDKAWSVIQNPVSAQENKDLGVILDSLEPTSDLYKTLEKLVTRYHGIYDGEDYLHTGLNYTDPEEVRKDLIDFKSDGMEDEDIKLMKKMSLEDLCSNFGYTLDVQYEPF